MEQKMLKAKEKKLRRKEELAGKKLVDEVIRKAYSKEDHLVDFLAFVKYDRNGIFVSLESNAGTSLSSHLKKYIQDLLKINMEGPYGAEWPEEEKVKWREMIEPDARYIIVKMLETEDVHKGKASSDCDLQCRNASLWKGAGPPVVAFVHYRFVVEEDIPVLYVYEIQLEGVVQGKGLGKFLMQLTELIARKNDMKAIMLTIQKRNVLAMDFYTQKLSFKVSNIAPSRVDPVAYADCTYEILCKTFNSIAKSALEDG